MASLPLCSSTTGARKAFDFDDALLGTRILVLGTVLTPEEGASSSPESVYAPGLSDGERGHVEISLRGGKRLDCSGGGCCDVDVLKKKIVADGVLRVEPFGSGRRYRLDDAVVCRVLP
jgi:hypothetical protein